MNYSDLSVTYNNGTLEVNTSFPSTFAISFMVVCFLRPLTDQNTDLELGNIETFLCNDSYYPQNSIGSRYSHIADISYVRTDTNCVRSPLTNNINFTLDQDIGNPWIAFLNNSGIVRGPKSGVIANYKSEKYSYQYVTRLIEKVKYDWSIRNISTGTILSMVPDLLIHRTLCIDEEIVISENRSIYNNLGPDPRNPSDGTRYKGLFPKCSSSSCFDNRFRSKFNSNVFRLHDNIFRANLMVQLLDRILNYRCN